MRTERAVIVKVSLPVVAAVSGIGSAVAQHRLCRIAHRNSGIVKGAVLILSISLQGIEVIVHIPVVGSLRPVLEREHGMEAQTLGNEVELLVKVQVGRDGAGERVLVSVDQTSQSVGIATVGQLAESPVYPTVIISILIHDGEEYGVGVHHL